LGAPGRQISRLFFAEAAMLSMVGAMLGLLIALAGQWVLVRLFPEFPIAAPLWAPIAAVGVALGSGLLFSVLPARRAARMDPVMALSKR
jgi:putative ABC transport system permease protein